MKYRQLRSILCSIFITAILASCAGVPIPIPGLATATPVLPTPTAFQQALPPALVETEPPVDTVIGHLSPLTFYFNQPMDKPTVESAFGGLPEGVFTWNDQATVVFNPAQPYAPDSKLPVTIASSIKSSTGFGIQEPVDVSFFVADYLRASNTLPKENAADVDVQSAVVVSFNQPVVPLGGDSSSSPPAFSLLPSVRGSGDWINTSTYIFYPDPALAGGTEYTVRLNPDLETETGVGLEGSAASEWKFSTALPGVVAMEPSTEQKLGLDPQIRLTFNQPMNTRSVEQNFVFSGPEGALRGTFAWSEEDTVLSFEPQRELERNAGYILNVGAEAESKGGMALDGDYGAVFNTYENFAVTGTNVEYYSVTFNFSSPLPQGDYDEFVEVNPPLENFSTSLMEDGLSLVVYGFFEPETSYTIELDAQLQDTWGQALGDPYVLSFFTAPTPAALNVSAYGYGTAFVRPDDPALHAEAVNVQNADVTVSPLTLQEYLLLQDSYENRQSFSPTNPIIYPHTFDLPPSEVQDVRLRLAQQGSRLVPDLYAVEIASPQTNLPVRNIYFVVSSQINLTFKLGATEALVWAVDLPSQTPVEDAPVTIYDNNGNPLASGTTDEDGVWKGAVEKQEDPVFAVLGSPGSENFALTASTWNLGISPWDFGYSYSAEPPHTEIYMYTDRPMYRPGQTVYFRGAARQAFNGRYELPQISEVPLILRDTNGTQLLSLNASLSPYGTFNGEYQLPDDAVPGYYTFENSDLGLWFTFQVAEYRKPEIDLSVGFSAEEIQQGDEATAEVNARYFFDAPVNDMEVRWALYSRPAAFHIPNYDTGPLDTYWLDPFRIPEPGSDYFGNLIGEGTGQTDRDGLLTIELPDLPEEESRQILTLEVSGQDESGLPVSARSEMLVHPAAFYIGILPDQWIGRADSALGFEIYTVDWAQNPSGDISLNAEFKQVRWEKETDSAGYPIYTPIYEPVSSTDFATGPDGKARLSFVPPTAGTYMLDVSGEGTRTQSMLWVSGAGTAAWPELPNQRLELTPDRETYQAGDTARVFIPNPFPANSLALMTIERGVVSQSEVISLSGSGREVSIPLTEADAPNVYLSIITLGQGNDFRGGLVNLPVAPDDKELNVAVSANPTEAGPRQDVTFDVQVTDNLGTPVEGEFSLSVVDEASLALADPNAPDILTAFYSNQPLGIETGLSVAVYTGRDVLQPGGMGGGGGGEVPSVREEFPDTAYWNPSLITNSEGRGQVTMILPDSLTTWKVDVRGLTVDTKVGESGTQIVSTKPLLIRPVTPRFLVDGDHVQMAAIVNNNTPDRLEVNVSLQSDGGFILDEPEKATQQLEVPASGRARVEWWGTAGSAEAADLIFSAVATGTASLEDSTRPTWGQLPILKYSAPQAFVTGGVLRGAASRQEVISLPRTFTPTGGGLGVEFTPSLAGTLLTALEAMEAPHTSSAESIVSYFLPNLEVYQALSGAGLNDPALTERVAETVDSSVRSLLRLQNEDGGWNWWGNAPPGEQTVPSDRYISAYVTFGLIRAHRAGVSVDENALQRAGSFLRDLSYEITNDTTGAELDEIAFIHYVLAQAGTSNEMTINELYNARERMSPSSQALLASVINTLNPADERASDLISNLEANAILTSASAHWESPPENIVSRGSTIYTTSLVVYILAQLDPANQVVFNAVNYLAAHRDAAGAWSSGHDNAWALLALNQAMLGFGDLNADFSFDATFNGGPLIAGDVAGAQVLAPSIAEVPLEYISPASPNLLTIQRSDGLGRLYYHTVLNVNRPVEQVAPLNAGLRVERVYCESDSEGCTPLNSLSLSSGETLMAQLTLVVPNDSYFVMVEDHIPAGMEILDRNLKTSQQAIDSTEVEVQYDERDPFADGWGWWLFHEPQIRDEGILFSADYLPAGTYVLTYTLVPLQAGEYRVLPAHAWQSFFPEVQGTSAGAVFEIRP